MSPFRLHYRSARSRKGRFPEGRPECGAGAAPAGGFANCSRAASGIEPTGTTTGPPGAGLTGRCSEPLARLRDQEARPEAEWWRSRATTRAAVERRKASALRKARSRIRLMRSKDGCASRRSASLRIREGCLTWWTRRGGQNKTGRNLRAKRAARRRILIRPRDSGGGASDSPRCCRCQRAPRQSTFPTTPTTPPEMQSCRDSSRHHRAARSSESRPRPW
jgi:hypothetical protein